MASLEDVAAWTQRGIVRAIGFLPPWLLRLFAGGAPIRLDGQELDPEVQLALVLLRLAGHRGLDTLTPEAARAAIRRDARTFAGAPIAMARVERLAVPGPAGGIPARLYVPHDAVRDGALIVYFHGGGWVVGDLDTHETACRFLARGVGASVLAVDYRRAPEHRFPAAVDDCVAAYAWAAREAVALGCSPARVAVAGDSAGGNLAAVVAADAVRAGATRPAAQLLVYPVTDLSKKHPSYRLFSDGFFLTEAEMDWYRGHYLPDETAALDPRASPLLAPDVRDLPPAIVVTAGFDVLRDEGEAYATRLRAAGVPVVLRRHSGQVHGFLNATGVSRSSRAAVAGAARSLRDALGG